MNIKDFSLNDALQLLGDERITGRKHQTVNYNKQRKPLNNNNVSSAERRGSVSRERINIKPENMVRAEDGTIFDRSAPKGSYVDILV